MFQRLLNYKILKKKEFYDRDKYDDIFQDPKSNVGHKLSSAIIACIIFSVIIVIFETLP